MTEEQNKPGENASPLAEEPLLAYRPLINTGEPAAIDDKDPGSKREKRNKRAAERSPGQRILREIGELLIIIVAAIIITTLLRIFVIDQYEIPTGSMEPTIEINDRLFAEKLSYRFAEPTPGDIVTFHDPTRKNGGLDRVLIKRCIAVSGQTVDLVNGAVVVDGVSLNEPYTHGQPSNPLNPMSGVEIDYPYTVPEGSIWVMGDNRMDSSDSRYFGPITRDELIGRALFRIWPLDRFGAINS
ncbi:MAG: signal peptidase I [Coriobacteriales bacterium]|nr:signal peptidase I [Coriobacteriales bacterium]